MTSLRGGPKQITCGSTKASARSYTWARSMPNRNWLDAEQIESSSEKKDLGLVVVEKLDMKW